MSNQDASLRVGGAPPYELAVDGLDPQLFRVRRFRGRDALSEAYSFEVVVTGQGIANEDAVERLTLGQRATFSWNVAGSERCFYGVVAAARLVGAHVASDAIAWSLRVVPRLWLLKRKRRTRIFQKMRVPDIVTAVLLEAGIAARWQLLREYPVREYCTQFEESDYRFVVRLLAEAGIYFYFAQGGPVDAALLTASAIVGVAAPLASSAVGALAGSAAGAVVGQVASAADPIIPGDTVIFGDDATFYPPLGPDDAALLAASSAIALAPEVGEAIGGAVGGMSPLGSAALGGASALAGRVAGALGEKRAPVLRYLAMQESHAAHDACGGSRTPPAACRAWETPTS